MNNITGPAIFMGRPVIYYGIFLEGKKLPEPKLSRKMENPHVTMVFRPTEHQAIPEDVLGTRVQVVITHEGCDEKNHGYKVMVPLHIWKYYKNDATPHLTISISEDGKPVDTANLEWEKLAHPIFVEGVIRAFPFE